MPVKGNLFQDLESELMKEKIRKEAAEVQSLGGGDFPGVETLTEEANSTEEKSVKSMTSNVKINSKKGTSADEADVGMSEAHPGDMESVIKKTETLDLTEEEVAQNKYDEERTKNFYQKIENPDDLDECLWNDFGPNPLNILRGCVSIAEQVYDTRFVNELGFLSEDLNFKEIVSEDTQEMLFDWCGDRPEAYKKEMLKIMANCIPPLTSEEDKKEAKMSYKKIENIEHESDNETYYNCLPGKT